MRLKDGDKRWVVERASGSGPKFMLRREDTAKAKARVESKAHPRVKFVVHAIGSKKRVYEALAGKGHPIG